MTDEIENPVMLLRDPNNEPVKFVNDVAVVGHASGVINITFSTALFNPYSDGKIRTDMIVGARLRLDMAAAQSLRSRLNEMLEPNGKDKPN